MVRWLLFLVASWAVAAAEDTQAACAALGAAAAVPAGAAVPCDLGRAPRWVALNNVGVAHWVLGRVETARAFLGRAARLAPLEPVPGHNLLWLAAAARGAADAELTPEVVEFGRRLEAAALADALARAGGGTPGTTVVLHGGAAVSFDAADGAAAATAPAWAAAEAAAGDDAPWAADAEGGGHALALADLGLGAALCDFPGMATSAARPAGAAAAVGVVKRWVTGYLEAGDGAAFDIGYETVGAGGAAAWERARDDVRSFAHVGSLNLVEAAVSDAVARGVPGDVAECGVFRGGTAAVAAAALEAADPGGGRVVWAADTFGGIPAPRVPGGDAHTDAWPAHAYAAPAARVVAAFDALGLGARLRVVAGAFADALPAVEPPLAVLRLDADTYEGTRDALEALYDRVSAGGYVIVDDYHLGGCRRAVAEFRAARNATAAAPLLPAPIDYVLGCPRLDASRAAALANDVLRGTAAIRADPMRVAQNVYWVKPS